MDVGNIGEDMVLNLVVQPSGEPVHDAVTRPEIYGGLQLVDGPGVLHVAVFLRQRHLGVVHHVGKLKYHA